MRATHYHLSLSLSLLLCCAAWLSSTGCTVKMPDDSGTTWSCKTSADCDGDGYVCIALATGPSFCCKPSPEECDAKDNDCNGKVDDVVGNDCYSGPEGTAGVGLCKKGTRICASGAWGECLDERTPGLENCNGFDDDCDGQTDEDFDFNAGKQMADGTVAYCGNCSTTCIKGQWCANGKCSKDTESCNDAIDNDRDGATDCADTDCLSQPCQATPSTFTCDALLLCSCHGVVSPPPEAVCDDHGDDDCDGVVDCADSDCATKSCGVGCTCKDLKMSESACDNARDDDGDGKQDCEDDDCLGASCGSGCQCGAAKKSETDCTDGVDNDGDFKRDCKDDDCSGKACTKSVDGGTASGTCNPSTFQCE